MHGAVFSAALVIAVAGLAVAGRFLYLAWSDYRFQKERRQGLDRRHQTLPVPMERRIRQRRSD